MDLLSLLLKGVEDVLAISLKDNGPGQNLSSSAVHKYLQRLKYFRQDNRLL